MRRVKAAGMLTAPPLGLTQGRTPAWVQVAFTSEVLFELPFQGSRGFRVLHPTVLIQASYDPVAPESSL